jgi:uncharacterized linocin/CFP29 family protein
MSNGVQIDTISAQGGSLKGAGDVATRLMQSGFNVNALRTNDVLRKDEWVQMDNTLVEVMRQRTPLVQMLTSAGLTYSIPNGLGTTILEWEDVSDMEPADVSMAGVTRGEQDTLEYDLHSMPLPIIHKDFTLNIRKLQASRTTGMPLDMAQAELASRLVAEKVEDMVITGHATRVGNAQIYGLTNVPNAHAITMTGTTNWDTDSTGAQIVADVLSSIAALEGDHMYGPYTLLVNYAQWNRFQQDYDVSGNSLMTIAERVGRIAGISRIVPSSNVATGTAYVVQMTRDVIDEVIGMQPTMVQWETQGGMQMHFKVMAIMVPRIRWTQTLQSGVAKIS